MVGIGPNRPEPAARAQILAQKSIESVKRRSDRGGFLVEGEVEDDVKPQRQPNSLSAPHDCVVSRFEDRGHGRKLVV